MTANNAAGQTWKLQTPYAETEFTSYDALIARLRTLAGHWVVRITYFNDSIEIGTDVGPVEDFIADADWDVD